MMKLQNAKYRKKVLKAAFSTAITEAGGQWNDIWNMLKENNF